MLTTCSFLTSAIALLAALPNAFAQVSTDCNPLNTTDCPPDPAFGTDFNFQFNKTPADGTWDTTAGDVLYTPNFGAKFQINKQGDSPTIRSSFYVFWGRFEIWMKAASGTGIISSMMLLSDDLDEIDWEFMGGNSTHAETNYFGKGAQDFHNAIYYPVNNGVQDDYHNYTIDWTKDRLEFHIDGSLVRTLLPKEANNSLNYPQTPMRLSLGIWAGGDPTLPEGTRQWAGGDTNYNDGPFTMYVRSTRITDYSKAKEYVYGDTSGSFESIKLVDEGKNSTVEEAINAPPPESISDKFNNLSPTAKLAIYASAAGVGVVLLAWALFYCIRQRRRGAREAALAMKKQEEERLELERFKMAGINPDSFAEQGIEYNAKEMAREGVSSKDSYSVPASPSNEKWETAAALGAGAVGGGAVAANGMRSPMPLLREGAQSPRVASPGPNNSRGPYAGAGYSPISNSHSDMRSPGPMSPMRTASPGMPPPGPLPANPSQRSFSSPNAQMRIGSPGPQQGGYGGGRVNSPGPMAAPQRSFTNPRPPMSGYGGQAGSNGDYWR